MTPIKHNPDIAQAQVFMDLLNTEIDVLAARIAETEADARRPGALDRPGARVRPEEDTLRARLSEAHHLVARLTARYPELRGVERN
ncbi:hypothetical protein P3H15_42155 [Rhodococcus sp. T2V]|uniref:hypothetical protein n=1 Tax=Rhodococcus sp. T2V TaxID=3034164 RepID=UPI0023E12E5A|nr:hypothetical protein [Rhodococcus sp. T2V]MDF3311585.1 hypothetical protein [Rhodococcus sp. T2V]